MDQQNDTSGIDSTYRLLALCARAEGHPLLYEQLKEHLHGFKAWKELPAQAEIHGMAPLLWHHIHQAGLSLPRETEQTLRGLYIRQRAFHQAYTQVLVQINSLFEQAGIRTVLLKGLALAYEYYPDPAVRPVNDIDLFLKRDEVLDALDLLKRAGFRLSYPAALQQGSPIPKGVVLTAPMREGVSVLIELHHFDPRHRSPKDNTLDDEFSDFDTLQLRSLRIGNCVVDLPTPQENLRYLSKHFTRHMSSANQSRPMLLKWVADVISIAEHHAEEIDWDRLRQTDRLLFKRLEVFYSFTPMPACYRNIIPIQSTQPPRGINQYSDGWPQQPAEQWRKVGLSKFLRQTFASPSVWWLRLYYGIDDRSCFWYGRVVYPLQILRSLLSAIIHRARSSKPSRTNPFWKPRFK
jgi:hypothetical protein